MAAAAETTASVLVTAVYRCRFTAAVCPNNRVWVASGSTSYNRVLFVVRHECPRSFSNISMFSFSASSLYIAASFLSWLRGSHGLAGSVGDGNSHGDPNSSPAANRLLTAGARKGTVRPVRVFVAPGDNSTMNGPDSYTP